MATHHSVGRTQLRCVTREPEALRLLGKLWELAANALTWQLA
jgi:hypothetical protein